MEKMKFLVREILSHIITTTDPVDGIIKTETVMYFMERAKEAGKTGTKSPYRR